jgi:glycosyltransferase involved in cell wall biosynthesis
MRVMPNDMMLSEHLAPMRHALRVAFVTETYPPEVNGVARTVARFVEGLRELGHEIQIVRPRQGHDDGRSERGNDLLVRGLAIPNYPGLRMGLPARALLTRAWSRRRPDIVHVVTEGPLGWSALQAAASLDIPLTSDFRTNFDVYSGYYGAAWLKKPIAAYLRKFHNRTLITTAPTASLRCNLLELGYRNVQVVARGVDTKLFNPVKRSETLRSSWGAAPGDPVVGYVGRLAPEKNLPLVLEAFRHIRLRHRRARLVLVGDGPQRLQSGHDASVVQAGVRIGEDLAVHYASFDMFLFPSLTETFGNVTVEAMASGLPIVAYNYAAAAEHIEDGVTGLLADYGDARHFIEHAVRLMDDPDLARLFRARVRQAAGELHWDCVVKRMEAVLFAAAEIPAARHSASPAVVRSQPQRAAP